MTTNRFHVPIAPGRCWVILVAAASWAAFAQTPKAQFQVASVKPSETCGKAVQPQPGGGLRALAPLSIVIEQAFNVPAVQVLGGPAWMKFECYQIEAKAEGNPSDDQVFAMLRALLEDRFQLKAHRQKKELPVYLLLPTKGGPRLSTPKDGNCWPLDAPVLPPARGRLPSFFKCGRIVSGGGVDTPTEALKGGSVQMQELIRVVSIIVGRPIVDKTGFRGAFDVNITFAPEPGSSADAPWERSGLPNIFVALEEQLGLKLESAKAPVDVLIIDSVQRPSAN